MLKKTIDKTLPKCYTKYNKRGGANGRPPIIGVLAETLGWLAENGETLLIKYYNY